ncbi:YmfQ family protein [Providencia manganoxydans]|uniref:YmfQ family protein n=1 Tax=Providencia manganoxydans TaxID=2923283 RepID=UPI0034E4614F
MIPYTVEDYTKALISLAPQGLAWNWKPNTVMHAVLRGLARGYQSSDLDAIQLLSGAFPKTATVMLPEWEKTLGLPDDCAIGEMDSLPKRQRVVVSKLVSSGGQSKNYFINYAAELGYSITITEFRPARCGISACGDPLNGEDWPFVWRVNAGDTAISYALSGVSYCGDPLRSWGNRYLECALGKLCPPHTILQISYLSINYPYSTLNPMFITGVFGGSVTTVYPKEAL